MRVARLPFSLALSALIGPQRRTAPPESARWFCRLLPRKFITRKLWGTANSGPFMHHGKFTTMREAVHAHSGEALASRQAFEALTPYERDCLIEFLKTLQVLPQGTPSLVIDENAKSKNWNAHVD